MFKHFKLLTVRHLGHAVGDSGDPVVQVHLPGGHVDRVVLFMAEASAPASKGKKRQHQQCERRGPEAPEHTVERDWRLREHSQWRSS